MWVSIVSSTQQHCALKQDKVDMRSYTRHLAWDVHVFGMNRKGEDSEKTFTLFVMLHHEYN